MATYDSSDRRHKIVADPTFEQTWVKMPFVKGLSDAGFKNDDDEVVADKLVISIQKFHNDPDSVWKEIGKIVAVDIFNGNNDRFNFEGEVQNIGNIMFVDGGETKVIGLDTFDPGHLQYSNINEPKDELKEMLNMLAVLKEAKAREEFSFLCLMSLGVTFAEAMRDVKFESVKITLNGRTNRIT